MANFPLNYSYSRNLGIPLDEDAVMATSAMVSTYVRTRSKCYPGQLFSVTGGTDDENGLYMALTTGAEGTILKVDSRGNGSLTVKTFDLAISAATNDNKGQIIYVETTTYAYGDGSGGTIYTTDKPEGTEGEDYDTYEAGPYIVIGLASLSKLGTSSASGEDVSSSIEQLRSQIAELQELMYWEVGADGGVIQ